MVKCAGPLYILTLFLKDIAPEHKVQIMLFMTPSYSYNIGSFETSVWTILLLERHFLFKKRHFITQQMIHQFKSCSI